MIKKVVNSENVYYIKEFINDNYTKAYYCDSFGWKEIDYQYLSENLWAILSGK